MGSARLLARLGFKALATSSSGFAWTLGRSDNQATIEESLAHIRAIAEAVDVPVNADFEGGFAVEPAGVAANVARATTTGVAGISIEDSTRDSTHPLFDFALAVERIEAARQVIDQSGTGVLLTFRSEGFIVGRPDLAEAIRRLVAYADAGADCLYAPGIRTMTDIGAVVRAVAPKPVNVLVGSDFTTVAELAEVGVRRISVGGALAGRRGPDSSKPPRRSPSRARSSVSARRCRPPGSTSRSAELDERGDHARSDIAPGFIQVCRAVGRFGASQTDWYCVRLPSLSSRANLLRGR